MGRARGFTLLELLVALAVLAVLAVLSLRTLSSVLDAERHVREEARRWSEVGLLLAQLREDVSSLMEGRSLALGAGADAELILDRFGDVPGVPPRRVGYRMRDGVVEYMLWPPRAGAGAPPSSVHAVLEGVAQLRFTALREDGSWTAAWPPASNAPRAIAVELVLGRGERVTRLYPLR